MILTCPSCTMRYIVSEGAIGPLGRKVRCASCGHEWQQQPEEGLDEVLFGSGPDQSPEPSYDEPSDFGPVEDMGDLSFMSSGEPFDETPPPSFVRGDEDDEPSDFGSMLKREMKEDISIPEGVKPKPEDMVLPVGKKKLTLGSRGGFVAAGVFYLFLLGVFLLMQPQISRAWPASNLVYGWFGMKPVLPGEGLTLDGLEAKIANGEIVMKGNIINLKSEPVDVPAVMAMIVDENNQIMEKVLIVPTAETVAGEDQLAFDVTYPSIPAGALNVNFAFSYVKAKRAEETSSEDRPDEDAHSEDAPAEESSPQEETADETPAAPETEEH